MSSSTKQKIGGLLWILSLQFFVTQIVVASAWPQKFSLNYKAISDLGNTECARYAGRFVCSPQHDLMNASFVLLGLTMILGSIFLYQSSKKSSLSTIGFSFMAISGLGTILVGLFPENTNGFMHGLGASLAFLVGNVGVIVTAIALRPPKSVLYFSLFCGTLALISLLLLVTKTYLGLGFGGIERLVVYPQTIWLITLGAYCLRLR